MSAGIPVEISNRRLSGFGQKYFVMPIDEDMFFPPRDCEAEQQLIPNSEFRVLRSIYGHLGLFGIEPDYLKQIDRHLGELLAIPV